jgi:hypothetical protein
LAGIGQTGPTPKEIKMRKTILTVLASALIAATSVQIAAAAERHHPRKVDRTTTVSASERFNNANNSIALPAESSGYSAYYTGGGMSAPAGH